LDSFLQLNKALQVLHFALIQVLQEIEIEILFPWIAF